MFAKAAGAVHRVLRGFLNAEPRFGGSFHRQELENRPSCFENTPNDYNRANFNLPLRTKTGRTDSRVALHASCPPFALSHFQVVLVAHQQFLILCADATTTAFPLAKDGKLQEKVVWRLASTYRSAFWRSWSRHALQVLVPFNTKPTEKGVTDPVKFGATGRVPQGAPRSSYFI